MRGFAGAPVTREELLAAPVRWPRPSRLDRPLTDLAGCGPKLAEAAAEAGIGSVGDMLWHLPRLHRDRAEALPIGELKIGEEATILGVVRSANVRRIPRRRLTMLEVEIADESGPVKATWWNQHWLADRMKPGTRVLVQGSLDRRGFKPKAMEVIEADSGERPPSGADSRPRVGARPPAGIHTTGRVPVHPATERLRQQRLREWAWQVTALAPHAVEGIPAEVRARLGLGGAADALRAAHFPASAAEQEEAEQRLRFEELLLHQTILAARRAGRRQARSGQELGEPGELTQRWIASLPFTLTDGQRAAFAELDADLASGDAMQRLLMGEVGSGKTVVAVYAMLRALESGRQAVLMAPTETLAEQHAMTLGALLADEMVPFAVLTGATPKARRREILERLASGELGMIVGTHALIEPGVAFARLGVVVVDEQHRFGVEQRAALDAKGPPGLAPHILHMTATPIPRTLSMTAYGDLDTTALRELPAGRRPVTTRLVEDDGRAAAYELLRERLREGRQAFVVCPLVSASEKLEGRAAEAEAERLAAGELSGFRVGLLHGQMSSADKAESMGAFAEGETDVLVATTVIEVGIDVPNATVMLIEGSERFGVSQLHQLRGRIGRGEHASECLLFHEDAGELARRRLEAVERERDGFALAEVDLALRGEGEILGTRQSGLPRFALADLPDDLPELLRARSELADLLRRHGSLDAPELTLLLEAARRRFDGADEENLPA